MVAARTKRLLVPLDGSELSDGVLEVVERFQGQESWEVVLLRVLEGGEEDVPGRASIERDPAVEHLARVRTRLEAAGARVTSALREGDPAAEILRAIEEHRPSLLAMTTHGRSGVPRLVRGSVAERVLRAGAAPLLLVTPRWSKVRLDRFRRILVPLDGSEWSAGVLDLVEDLARRQESEVVLLRVGDGRPLLPWLERLAAQGVRCREVTAGGDPAQAVLDVAEREGTDLIAMTTHGRAGLSRLVNGSVSEAVLRSCRRPLLLVNAGPLAAAPPP